MNGDDTQDPPVGHDMRRPANEDSAGKKDRQSLATQVLL